MDVKAPATGLVREARQAVAGAGVAKPHPGIFRRALAELDVEPEATLHVGDSVRKDYEGARNAGMQSLLLDRTGHYAGRGFDSIDRLEGVLDRLGVAGYANIARAHAS